MTDGLAKRIDMINVFGGDPGSTGALVWLRSDKHGNGVVETLKFAGATRREMIEFVVERADATSTALVEKVSASPQMGVVSSFTFGRSYERLLMALTAGNVSFERILPRAWQKAAGVYFKPKTSHTEHKRVTRQRAQELYPTERVTNATADALLIAHVALKLKGGF
jgi:hypothetical protein